MSDTICAGSAWVKSCYAICWSVRPPWVLKNVLAVIFGHNHPSLHLFHSFGFQEWGRLPAVCDLETFEADVVILGKQIT